MGLGLLSGRAAPPLFVFLGWGACARDRAEGGRVACLACGLWAASAWAPRGRVIGRVSGCVSVGGCPAGRWRGLAPGGVARASVGGLLLAFVRDRVAGRA